MESEMRNHAQQISEHVDVHFVGYVSQAELPSCYGDARIFLFPSEWDPWGVVANEACASGLPVIVSPHAGAAGELINDGSNGFVRDLNLTAWTDAAVDLLTDDEKYQRFSKSSLARVAEYTFEKAAHGLASAIRHAKPKRSVCIVQAVAKQYRLPFFDRLQARLASEGILLSVVYSAPNKREALRKDAVDLPTTYGRKIRAFWSPSYRVLYQPSLTHALSADMVIVEQASKHVLNYQLAMLRFFGLVRLAYWGHGRNWQHDGEEWMEPIKHALMPGADWWFAYTKKIARYVEDSGFPADRITVVQNSVDVDAFKKAVEAFDHAQQQVLRRDLGIAPDAPVGLFCSSMHASKKLDFLVDSATLIHTQMPDFHLVLIGGGPDESISREAAATHDWIHYTGPLFGTDKAAHFAIADIFLCPGLVGLSILEAFAAGLPLFTTDLPVHSPEIDYLTDSVTGAITAFDSGKYAEAVSTCLNNRTRLSAMREATRQESSAYGLEPMVENFTHGVLACLSKS
jgi:glycosyltransferase involved in cell wall biosynthesis